MRRKWKLNPLSEAVAVAIVGIGVAIAGCSVAQPAAPEAVTETVAEQPIKAVVLVYPDITWYGEESPLTYVLVVTKYETMTYTGEEYLKSPGLQKVIDYLRFETDVPVSQVELDLEKKDAV